MALSGARKSGSRRGRVGEYDAERAGMDYEYFPRYHEDGARAAAQDAIVSGLLEGRKRAAVPWLTYLCGAYGSGKSHSVRRLWSRYLADAVHIDPDAIKTLLTSGNGHGNLGGELHREATFVALLAERAAIARRLSAVIDGSLHDHAWYGGYLDALRAEAPEYRLCIVRVDCESIATILQRCSLRAARTGRSIPETKLREIHAKIPASFEQLRARFDCLVVVDNSLDNLPIPRIAEIRADRDHGQPWPNFAPFLSAHPQNAD
jgi:predicted ABC-type ATPase